MYVHMYTYAHLSVDSGYDMKGEVRSISVYIYIYLYVDIDTGKASDAAIYVCELHIFLCFFTDL
jgi:hypothetical protein